MERNLKVLFKMIGIALLLGALMTASMSPVSSATYPTSVKTGLPEVIIRAVYTENPPDPILLPDNFFENSQKSATINVTYINDWDPQAHTAFEYAVDIWENLITSPVTIEIRATWTPLEPNVLGSAGPMEAEANFNGAIFDNTFFPIALANKLAGSDLSAEVDIQARFNSSFPSWYFGIDGNVPADQHDFVTVVIHEIAHGLGFVGSMIVDDDRCGENNGCWGYFDPSGFPLVYDRFTRNGDRISLLNFPNYSSELAALLTSGQIFFDGPLANAANAGFPSKLFAPPAWDPGSSYSHLDEVTFNNSQNALMTPQVANGEVIHLPGSVTLGIFNDMGWSVTWPDSEPAAAIVEHCGEISSSQTWFANGVIHVITCDVTIPNGVTLTIEQGTIIKVKSSGDLFVDGSFQALGSSDQKIYITSIRDDTVGGDTDQETIPPAAGNWGRVHFRPGSSGELDYVELRYGGYLTNGMLYTEGGTNITIDNGVFKSASDCAISSDSGYEPTLLNMDTTDFTGSVYNGLCMRGASITNHSTWDETEVSHVLYDDLTVSVGASLTLGLGVVVKPRTTGTELFVDGSLTTQGTAENRVYITSIKDDTIGGLTNNNTDQPASGNWGKVHFRPGSSGELDYVELRYGGYLTNGMLYTEGGTNITIDNGVFKSASDCAISSDSGYEPTLLNMDTTDFTGSVYNGLCMRGASITNHSTWDETEVSHVLYDDLTVSVGASLTLGLGVVVKPRTTGTELFVDGSLTTQGTAENRVYITSIKDDTIGGLTNNNTDQPASGNWGKVHFRPGSSGELDYVELRYGGYLTNGMLYTEGGTNITIDNGVFKSASDCAISSDSGYEPTLLNMDYTDFTGNAYNGMCMRGASITNHSTWDETEVSHVLYDDLTVSVGASLTLGLGVVVKPRTTGTELFVDGSLTTQGTAENRVYITSIKDDTIGGLTNNNTDQPASGNWGKVHFRPGSSGELDYVELRYGGYLTNGMLYTEGGTNITIDNGVFKSASDCAISSDSGYEPTLLNMDYTDFTGNAYNGMCMRGASITNHSTWDETEATHVLYDDLTVAVGASLTLSPGLVVKPRYDYTDLFISGNLVMNGTSDHKVYITSIKDDSIGGLTNNNADTPAASNWGKINFLAGSSGNINYAEIWYGGYLSSAIYVQDSSPLITYSTIRNNNRGVHVSGAGSHPLINFCLILNNSDYGVYNSQAGNWIDATNNWWGSDDGPYDPPGTDGIYNDGSGDRVNDYVLYSPWLQLYTMKVYLPMIVK